MGQVFCRCFTLFLLFSHAVFTIALRSMLFYSCFANEQSSRGQNWLRVTQLVNSVAGIPSLSDEQAHIQNFSMGSTGKALFA